MNNIKVLTLLTGLTCCTPLLCGRTHNVQPHNHRSTLVKQSYQREHTSALAKRRCVKTGCRSRFSITIPSPEPVTAEDIQELLQHGSPDLGPHTFQTEASDIWDNIFIPNFYQQLEVFEAIENKESVTPNSINRYEWYYQEVLHKVMTHYRTQSSMTNNPRRRRPLNYGKLVMVRRLYRIGTTLKRLKGKQQQR